MKMALIQGSTMLKTMKSLFILGILFPVFSFAQSDFEVPGKWGRAPAIIMNQESDFHYLLGEKAKEIEVSHTETIGILINSDKGAEIFKNVFVPEGYDVEVEVVRASGSVVSFDEGDGDDLSVADKVTYFFADVFKNHSEFEKINLGALSKGDEINLEYSWSDKMVTKEYMGSQGCKAFATQIITIPTIYPKGGHNIRIEMDKSMYLNYGSMADGPSISDESDLEGTTSIFEIEAGQYDAYPKQHFAYPARMFATAKFEVIYCAKGKAEGSDLMLGENPGEANEEFSEDELKKVVFNKYAIWEKSYAKQAKALSEFMGELRVKGGDDWLKQHYRGLQSYVYNTGKVEDYNADMFMGVMLSLLNNTEYEYQVVAGVDGRSATLDDMVLNSEVRYGIKVLERKDNYYVYPFNKYTNWDGKDYLMANGEAFIFTREKKLDDCGFDEEDLPTAAPAENQTVVRANLKLGDGFTAMIISKNTNLTGKEKTRAAASLLSVPDYHKAMLEKTQYQDYADLRDEDDAEAFKNRRKAIYEMRARSLFDTVEYQRFSVKKTGFEEDNAWLAISEKFTIPEDVVKFQIKDSTRIYTVALGAFIESDFEVSKDDFKREGEVFVEYPRIYDIRMRFKVPDGYVVFGFEEFDTDMSTDFASLKSTAEQKGNEVIVTCSFVIKSTDEITEDEWAQFYNMLERLQKLSEITMTMAGN